MFTGYRLIPDVGLVRSDCVHVVRTPSAPRGTRLLYEEDTQWSESLHD